MKNIFLKSIIAGIGFFGTLFLGMIVFSAWTNISTQNTGTTITHTLWNELVNNINTIGTKVDTLVPTGAIMAFNLSTCPTGRIAADGNNGTPNLRGEFIRGWDFNNSGVDNGRALGSLQSDSIKNHRHYANPTNNSLVNGAPDYANALINLDIQSTIRTTGDMVGGGTETRPRNLAFLYCIKQ